MHKISETYVVKIFASGPIEQAKQILRRECLYDGLCVTIESTLFIYTGGEENGYVVGLLNYPRFPAANELILSRAMKVAQMLLDETYQHSILIVDSEKSYWITKRT